MPTGLNNVVYSKWDKEKKNCVCSTKESNGGAVWIWDGSTFNLSKFYEIEMEALESAVAIGAKYK